MCIMSSHYLRGFSSRDYFALEFIPFVTPSNEPENSTRNSIQKPKLLANSITGKEASKFYNDILSIPSTSSSPLHTSLPKLEKTVKPSVNISIYNPKYIHKYAQEGDLKAIKYCLNDNVKDVIDEQDMYGWTPIMCASCEGHSDVVRYLLKCGADLDIHNGQSKTALQIAIEKERFNVVDILKNGLKLKPQIVSQGDKKSIIEQYCEDCKLSFKEQKIVHERSIAHLFSSTKADHTTFYHIPENNKGFQMMVKKGWDQNKGLGSKEEGRKFPIKTILKKDRSCIGKYKQIARVTHFDSFDKSAIKRISDPAVKLVREKTLKKWQRVKLENKRRHKEIEFRRQFICDY